MLQKGFTLLEVLVAVSLMLILIGTSYSTFINFYKNQRLNSAFEDLRNTLTEARESALSQASSKCLSNYDLIGYSVDFTSDSYALKEVCRLASNPLASYVYYTKKTTDLSGSELNFTTNQASYLFLVLTGEFGNSGGADGQIQLSNGSSTKTIQIAPIGRISVP